VFLVSTSRLLPHLTLEAARAAVASAAGDQATRVRVRHKHAHTKCTRARTPSILTCRVARGCCFTTPSQMMLCSVSVLLLLLPLAYQITLYLGHCVRV
jgi:hypothetical protein